MSRVHLAEIYELHQEIDAVLSDKNFSKAEQLQQITDINQQIGTISKDPSADLWTQNDCDSRNENCKLYTTQECFGCGLPVCRGKNCSRRIRWYRWGFQRICKGCEEDHGEGRL